jgi:hypothetical protein
MPRGISFPEMSQVELLAGEKYSYERGASIVACNDWLRLGATRTLPILWEQYTKVDASLRPCGSLHTLRAWHARFGWPARAEIYDGRHEEEKEKARAEVLQAGLALPHERILKLTRLANLLEDQIYQQDEAGHFINLWLQDVKVVGHGHTAKQIDLVRFNPAIIDQFRGTLDDIAKEVGGRKAAVAVTGKDDGPVEVKDVSSITDTGRLAGLMALYDRVRTRAMADAARSRKSMDTDLGGTSGGVPE